MLFDRDFLDQNVHAMFPISTYFFKPIFQEHISGF